MVMLLIISPLKESCISLTSTDTMVALHIELRFQPLCPCRSLRRSRSRASGPVPGLPFKVRLQWLKLLSINNRIPTVSRCCPLPLPSRLYSNSRTPSKFRPKDWLTSESQGSQRSHVLCQFLRRRRTPTTLVLWLVTSTPEVLLSNLGMIPMSLLLQRSGLGFKVGDNLFVSRLSFQLRTRFRLKDWQRSWGYHRMLVQGTLEVVSSIRDQR